MYIDKNRKFILDKNYIFIGSCKRNHTKYVKNLQHNKDIIQFIKYIIQHMNNIRYKIYFI